MTPDQDQRRSEEKRGAAPTDQEKPPAAPTRPAALPHQPGLPAGHVDVVGPVPEDIRIDPDLTEGHPGYEDSGASEIIPLDRLTDRPGAAQEDEEAR